jgi:Carboxypeptidase regulatory-like domain/TonB dependent receptor
MHASIRNSQRGLLQGLLILAVLLPAMLFAQGYFGTVSGVLTDASGAIVQGARVTLVDEQKGYQFTATSDTSGRYLFASIPPGTYSVTAEMPGFEKTVRSHIKLNVSENPTANLTLKVAGGTQKVFVEAQAQGIATEDATTGQVIDRRLINDLPIISRDVTQLTYLTAGVTDVDDQCQNCGSTNFVSNGSRGASADILMDGASVTNFEPNGGVTQAVYTPSAEAVEEFKVQQTNFSAEYGFSGSSILNMVTRSGTNKFHGSAYDFVRNTITDANDWFNKRAGQPIPPVHRHNYGGTIGGPVFKNKTFFFFDWDGYRSSDMRTHTAGVPSAAERTGDFGEICAANNGTFDSTGLCSSTAGQLWDPYSVGPNSFNSADGGPVRNTFIPYNNIANYISPGTPNLPANLEPTPGVKGNLIDPVAQKMLNLFPTANNTAQGIYNNWIASGATVNAGDQFDIKIDHRFSDKNLLSARYSKGWSNSIPFNCFKNFVDPCGGGSNKSTTHLFTVNDAYTINPTLLLTSTLGITRGAMRIFAYNSSLNPDPLGALGFPAYLKSNGFNGVPAIFWGDYNPAGFTNVGGDPYGNYKQGQLTGQLAFVLSKIHGPHELKFGFEGRLHQQNYIQTNAPLGFFAFDNTGTSLCSQSGVSTACADAANQNNSSGGDSMASFLMGQFTQNCAGNGCGSTYEIQFQPATENYQYAWFAQDNWKATPKLTLNVGLRYDVTLPRTDRFNHQNWFDPNAVNPLNGGKISYTDPLTSNAVTRPLLGGEVFANPSTRTNYVTDWKDIQPRFGLAFQFAPKMVLRGGYGIYYGQSRSGASGVVPYGNAGFSRYTDVITTYQNDKATPYLHLSNPYPNGLNLPKGSSLGLLNDVGFGANGPLRIAKANLTPYEQSWSLGIERQLPWNVVFEADYLGKKGTHLPFSGTTGLNILGPWVENYAGNTPQMNQLVNTVNNPFAGIVINPNSSLSSPTVQAFQLELPDPEFIGGNGGVTTDVEMIGSSIYHGLQLNARKAFSNGLEFLVNYTWSKSIDDSSVGDDNVTWLGGLTSLQDPNKPWLERSLSTFDIPSVLKFSYSYDLPFGRGRMLLGNMPRVLDAVIGGWRTNGIWQISDGRPLVLSVSGGGKAIPTYGNQRPNISGRLKRNYGHDWVDQFFADPNAGPTATNPVGDILNIPAPFTLGNTPRAIANVRSPLSFTSDLSIIKQFLLSSVHEGVNLEVRLEAQNAFNHPLFSMGTPGANGTGTLIVGDPSFGTLQSMTPVGSRQVQLAVKVSF